MLPELPLSCEPVAGESGPGYCLRAVSLNGLNLHWLRRAAGVGYIHLLDVRFASELSWILGCRREWLAGALPERGKADQAGYFKYAGQVFLFRNQLRLRNPQICIQCVHHDDVCRAVWDLSLVTCCTRHGCNLVDACAHCRAPLRWDRPAIGVCNCGRPFVTQEKQLKSSTPALELASAAEAWLYNERWSDPSQGSEMPKWLYGLSLSGLFCLVQAFGVRAKAFQPCSAAIMTRAGNTNYWSEVSARGMDRIRELRELRELRDDIMESFQQLEPFVSRTLIEHLVLKSPVHYDHQVGAHLLGALYGDKLTGRLSGPLPQLSQADLFGWSYA